MPSSRCVSSHTIFVTEAVVLLAVPHLDRLLALDFLLQLQQSVQQRLGRWRTSRHVDIDGHNPITSAHHGITVVVVPTSVGATVVVEYNTKLRTCHMRAQKAHAYRCVNCDDGSSTRAMCVTRVSCVCIRMNTCKQVVVHRDSERDTEPDAVTIILVKH